MTSAINTRVAYSQDWSAMNLDYGIGNNAFTACPPRSTAPDSHIAPKKRGPKPSPNQRSVISMMTPDDRLAAKTAKALAFKPGQSTNFTLSLVPSKTISRAQGAMRTA